MLIVKSDNFLKVKKRLLKTANGYDLIVKKRLVHKKRSFCGTPFLKNWNYDTVSHSWSLLVVSLIHLLWDKFSNINITKEVVSIKLMFLKKNMKMLCRCCTHSKNDNLSISWNVYLYWCSPTPPSLCCGGQARLEPGTPCPDSYRESQGPLVSSIILALNSGYFVRFIMNLRLLIAFILRSKRIAWA